MKDKINPKIEFENFFKDADSKSKLWLKKKHIQKKYLERLGEFKNVRSLVLEEIKEIPTEIFKLPANEVTILRGTADGIENFKNMDTLDLQVTPVPEEFIYSKKLKSLNINQSFCKIPLPESIADLTNLEKLSVRYTYTTDISSLSSLVNLTDLELTDCNIQTLEALVSLKKMKRLIISSSENLKSIDHIENLVNLEFLDITGEFRDITPLSVLSRLNVLKLNCECSDLKALQGLGKLEELNIGMCHNVRSIEPIKELSNIKRIEADQNLLNKWELRHIPESSGKIFTLIEKPSVRLRNRMEGLLHHVSSYSHDEMSILPIGIGALKKLLLSVDDESVITDFKESIEEGIASLDSSISYGALVYEWYESSSPSQGLAMGLAHEKCEGPFRYSKTDLFSLDTVPGIEMDDPELSGEEEELIELDLNPVRDIWYDKVCQLFDDDFRRTLVGKNLLQIYNDTEQIFKELFQIRAFLLLNRAYCEVKVPKPRFCFIGIHGRWPVLISDF